MNLWIHFKLKTGLQWKQQALSEQNEGANSTVFHFQSIVFQKVPK